MPSPQNGRGLAALIRLKREEIAWISVREPVGLGSQDVVRSS